MEILKTLKKGKIEIKKMKNPVMMKRNILIKKQKKNAQQNSKRSINLKHGPLEGKKGILVTCQTGKEKRAMAELFNLFEDYAEQLYPNEEDISRNEEKEVQERELSIEKELELEIQALKEKKKTPIFQTFDTGCRGTFFMEILSPKINPVSFVHYIFEDIRKTKLQKTRFTCKLIPILNTCVSHYDKISKYSKEIIDPVLNEDKSIKSYVIEYNRRINTGIERENVMRAINECIKPWNVVDLKNSKYTIIAEIIKTTCFLSIFPNSLNFQKFNILKLTEDQN